MTTKSAQTLGKTVADIDTHVQGLATALAGYKAGYDEACRAVYAHAGGGFAGLNAQHELDARCGPQLLHTLVVQRLRALGCDHLLKASRAIGTLDATWADTLKARIQASVTAAKKVAA